MNNIKNIKSEELINEIYNYIRDTYGYDCADIFDDCIQLTDYENNVVNIYVNVESEDE